MVLIDIFVRLILISLDIISVAMLIRMLFPLFAEIDSNRFYFFLECITEPFIIPIRFLLVKFNLFQGTPFDWSFTITYLLIGFLRMTLPVI